jgi:hypothetical protein
MKEIVTVRLGSDVMAGDKLDPSAIFLVSSSRGTAMYEDEPHVIEQMRPGEHTARFEAEWDDATGDWLFGKRVGDA